MRAFFQDQTEVRDVIKQTHIIILSGVDWMANNSGLQDGPCMGMAGWMELMIVPMTRVRSFNERREH